MATLKFRRKTGTDAPGALVHGELGFTQNRLYFGTEAGTAIRLAIFDDHALVSHNHGYLSNTGAWTTSPATIASSDYLVIADHSDSSKLVFSTTQFGTGTTTWLANNGTWSTPTAAQVSAVPNSGGTMTGILYPQNNTSYTTGQARRIILSTGNPSGGSNGDVWIKYTA